jgi:uncharacterized protein YjiK
MKTLKIMSAIAVAGLVIFFWKDIRAAVSSFSSEKENELTAAATEIEVPASPAVSVKKTWRMPEELVEISGISVIDNERFVCVQDEMGTVFIYNTTTSSIEKKIPFTNPGDFEGIAVVDKTIWVVRSDGVLFELHTDRKDIIANKYTTSLTAKHNIEGLCYDKANNRLLLASKDGDPDNEGIKGIYGFDLGVKKLLSEPVYKLSTEETSGSKNKKKEKKQGVKPSALAIHPVSGDIYITDGPRSRLLVLDKTGGVKALHQLGKEFQQPEGIAFRDNGDLFISNEGSKAPGNIIQVEVK